MQDAPDGDHRPALLQDRSFWGMTATQFLGAFNDNVFKQLVLLILVDMARNDRSANLQGIATIVFAAPFILLSGGSGYLSDRYSKRGIVVTSKVLEILVMLAGMAAFWLESTTGMLVVLFCMGSQSAFFGPSKYGILPELFREKDLPRANGVILMTTFLAIIFGFSVAGMLQHWLGDRLWTASIACVLIAVAGTLTSLLVRSTGVAQPDLRFDPSCLAVPPATRTLLKENRKLLMTILVASLFWLVGGVVYPPAINDLGMLQLDIGAQYTGYLAACTGFGIAVGCISAGRMSHDRFDARLVSAGKWGMLGALVLLSLPGPAAGRTLLGGWGAAAVLVGLGFSAGLFTLPLQVYLQTRAPKAQKGRIIATMNLANWIGIASAGAYYHVWNKVLAAADLPHNSMFAAAALLLLPLLFYRPQSERLHME